MKSKYWAQFTFYYKSSIKNVALRFVCLFVFQICGVWRKVPRIYKQLLRDEKIWVALLDDKSASGGGGSSGGGSEGAV
jgi:hypothetical protein